MSNLTTAIQVKNLSFYYGNYKAIEGISLDIYKNQVTALIGPSGCGKSTFIKTINRISELEGKVKVEGRIEFFGQNIYDPKININRLRREIGMVFQKPNPFPMSIYENVAYGVRIAGKSPKVVLDEIVESALKGAALWDEVKDKLHQSATGLSGGQQQRLCIARSLAVRPEVLLMDEPCSALDPGSTFRIEQTISELSQTMTIVIVTHNMQQAARVSDYSAFMLSDGGPGELIEVAPTNELFSRPRDKRTEDYVTGRFG